jgi:hypothetical protein
MNNAERDLQKSFVLGVYAVLLILCAEEVPIDVTVG